MRLRTSITGPKISGTRKDSKAQTANGRRWDESAGRRPNPLMECIVDDVGRWLGDCAQDQGALVAQKACARWIDLARPGKLFATQSERGATSVVDAGHRSMTFGALGGGGESWVMRAID